MTLISGLQCLHCTAIMMRTGYNAATLGLTDKAQSGVASELN